MSFVLDKDGNYLPVLGESSGGGSGTSDHSQLTNLDYEHSGHTGFLNTDLDNVSDTGKRVITNLAMPSAKYDTITAGASGTQYTAPADGYFFIAMASGSGGGGWSKIEWEDGLWLAQNVASVDMNMPWIIPIRKGKKITITFMAGIQFILFRFYYCNS